MGLGRTGSVKLPLDWTGLPRPFIIPSVARAVSSPCPQSPWRHRGPSSHLSLFLSLLQFKMFRFPVIPELAEIAAASELARLPEIPGSPGRCGDV
jgi:hypothetical protein